MIPGRDKTVKEVLNVFCSSTPAVELPATTRPPPPLSVSFTRRKFTVRVYEIHTRDGEPGDLLRLFQPVRIV